jgi:hypothetical protein
MLRKSPKKVANFFFCEKCAYNTSKKSDYNKHLLTAKHKLLTSDKKTGVVDFICALCNKKYHSRVGLWSHKKKCMVDRADESKSDDSLAEPLSSVPITNTSIILDILKENQEFKNMLIEQQKENKELMHKMVEITQQQLVIPSSTTNTTINNNTTTNNNQTFNLNLFLNETCKDAMNIQEFIDNIKITFDELLSIGNAGFINGVSDIFIRQLRDLEVNKRPIHCTDAKRETIYLKDQDSWNKDDKEKSQLKKMLEKLEYKNVAALHNWCNENPDSKVNNTPNNLLKDKIFYQTLQGDDKTRDKIIKNISKEVTIEKQGILIEN